MKSSGVVVVVLLLVAAGAFWFTTRKSAPAVPGNVSESEVPAVTSTSSPSSLVSSFKDAMGLGQKMRCTYTGGSGTLAFTSTAYVDGNKFRSESETGGVKMFVVSDGENQYVWNSGSTQGFKMSKACLESVGTAASQQTAAGETTGQLENYEATLNAAENVRCEASDSADFSVPSDITFTDQCALMEQSRKMMEQYQDKLPAGMYPGQ